MWVDPNIIAAFVIGLTVGYVVGCLVAITRP